MTVREALRAIDVTVEDVFDLGTRRRTKQKEGSRRNVHEKSLREVEQVAGDEEMEALKRWVVQSISKNERLPSGRETRKR